MVNPKQWKVVRMVRWVFLKLDQIQARHERMLAKLRDTDPEMHSRIRDAQQRFNPHSIST